MVLRDLSLSVCLWCVCVLALGKPEECEAERALYLQVNKAGEVVLFDPSAQCQPTGSLNSDGQFLTGGMRIA